MDKKIITFEKEIKERKKSENYDNSIFQQNKQIEFVNKLFQNIDFDEKKICIKDNVIEDNVTIKKYQKKIENVKNEKIKKSLIELTKVFKEK